MNRSNAGLQLSNPGIYKRLSNPPTAFEKITFIGTANNSSFLNARPISLKALLPPWTAIDALSLYLT
jgi:hypothetical protein